MSYDLNIWSCQRVEADQGELKIGDYTVTIEKSVVAEDEDIPTGILLSLEGIKYLTSLHLQPYTDEKAVTDKAIRYANRLAKEFNGVVENPQLEIGALPTVKKGTFTNATQGADRVCVCWYMDCSQSLSVHLAQFIDLLEKHLPHALPRRYGGYEPPQFKYAETGKAHLISFLSSERFPVIYCTKPILHIFLSDAYTENQNGTKRDYRCNRVEIVLLKEAYLKQNWQTAVKRLFKEAARLFKPFYAEIIDEKERAVCSWWWKGIPAKRGNPIIIGEPYSTLCKDALGENAFEAGLYYFEGDTKKLKLPKRLISTKKLFVRSRGAILNADRFNYAKSFPFEKNKALLTPKEKLDRLWELWEIGDLNGLNAPCYRLMTYKSEVTSGGHSRYFFNAANGGDPATEVESVLGMLPSPLRENLDRAYTAFAAQGDVCDDTLAECDKVFYEHEQLLIDILNEIAQGIM